MTTEPHKPEPIEMARYDQAHAEAANTLDALIRVHREEITESGEKRELCIVGLSVYLLGGSDAESLASLLALAVDRLTGDPS